MERVLPVFEGAEHFGDVRMIHRLAGIVGNEVLLGNIGHVIGLIVLGQKVIEGLFLGRAAFLGNGGVPFFRIGKLRIHIKNHAAERMFAVPDNLSEMVFCASGVHNLQPLPPEVKPFKGCLSNHPGEIQGKQFVNLALTVLEIVAPVFLLAGTGFAWVRAGFEYRIEFVTRLSMTLAVPCLIFTALMKTEVDLAALANLTLASLAAYGAVGLAGAALLALARLNHQTFLAPFIFGNTGNLGIPLALFAFGQPGLERAVVLLAVSAVLSFTLGIWLVAGRGSLLKILKEPMIGATLLGAIFLWQGWETPRFLTNTLDLIGQMAIPLMLLTLGVAVARLTPARITTAIWLSVAKLVICAALSWGIARAFGLDDISFGVLVLQISTPVAVTAYLIAEKYGADSQSVAGFVVVSTLISVAGLPLLLALVL